MKAMKLLTACAVLLTFQAAEDDSLCASLSPVTNGIYLAVGGWEGSVKAGKSSVKASERLLFMPFCDAGEQELAYPLDRGYLARFKLTDGKGRDVAKSTLGGQFGGKFDRLKTPEQGHCYPITASGPYLSNTNLGGAKLLPSTDELFKIPGPGSYTLSVEMQMFLIERGTNVWSPILMRFAPVILTVEKPR